MFDTAQHGTPDTHRYRSHYDAQVGSTTVCAYCGRTIRFCYAMHDQYGKTFIIGTCHFSEYKGTKAYVQLRAARILQEALLRNIRADLKFYGDKAEVRERRKAWNKAKREGVNRVFQWRAGQESHSEWLPKELHDLRAAYGEKPPRYKRQSSAVRWYEKQTEKIIALTNQASSI